MSTYYSYYIGIEDKETKVINPLGIYDCFGKLHPVISRSRSFDSDFYDLFYGIPNENIGDELRKNFEYEDWNGEKVINLRYLPYEELPSGDYIVRGYFNRQDWKNYKHDGYNDDLFYTLISEHEYIDLLNTETRFRKPQDEFEYCSFNYIYDAVPKYQSQEYDAHLIRSAVDCLTEYNEEVSKKYNIVIIALME